MLTADKITKVAKTTEPPPRWGAHVRAFVRNQVHRGRDRASAGSQ